MQWDAESYDRDFGFVTEYGGDLLDLIDVEPPAAAIDIGCGTGAHAAVLAGRGCDVLGVDLDVAMVARAAAATRVPLGFFRNFLLQDDADEGRVLDLKGQAIAPIVDLARTHALANATHATNTLERLRAASVAGSLDPDAAGDLGAAFEFVRDVRFRHQAEQIAKGEPPSNKLAPDSFSRFDREHLRDAFRLIRTQLDSLRTAYAGGMA